MAKLTVFADERHCILLNSGLRALDCFGVCPHTGKFLRLFKRKIYATWAVAAQEVADHEAVLLSEALFAARAAVDDTNNGRTFAFLGKR